MITALEVSFIKLKCFFANPVLDYNAISLEYVPCKFSVNFLCPSSIWVLINDTIILSCLHHFYKFIRDSTFCLYCRSEEHLSRGKWIFYPFEITENCLPLYRIGINFRVDSVASLTKSRITLARSFHQTTPFYWACWSLKSLSLTVSMTL